MTQAPNPALMQRLNQLTPEQRKAVEVLMARKKEAALQSDTPQTLTIKADPAQAHEPFPLTDIQQAQWFGRSGLFDITVAGHGYVEFDCKGMDLARLESSFRLIIDRNPQMRMVVLPGLQQQVLKEVPPYAFRQYDMRNWAREDIDRQLLEIRERMSHDILPADKWPIYEVCASVWDEDELRIHFSFDLLVGDAWCFRMIMDEWARLYDDPSNSRPIPDELSYRDYVLGFEEIEKTEQFAKDLAYWRNQLEDLAPAPQLPMIRKPADIEKVRAQHHKISLGAQDWSALKQKIQSRRLTPSAFFAAAFSEVISLWNASPRHALNVTVFNRLPVHPDIDDILVGEFNSFQLLNVDNGSGESFAVRSGKLQSLLWRHLEHRWVTGVRLMRELAKIQGVGAGDSLMPVVFTSTIAHHEGESDLPTRSPGEWIYEVSQTPQVWMEHHLWEEGDALSLHIDVVEGLFPDGLIQDFVGTYDRLVRALAHDDTAWDQANAAHLLPAHNAARWAAYNQTAAPLQEGLLHDDFARMAALHPDKTAIQSARGTISYAALNRQSNRIANYLQSKGVQPDELVAIVAPKGWEQIACALGIVKAGAAYLPIDHDQPNARLRDILTDASVRHVLSTTDTIDTISWPGGVTAIAIDAPQIDSCPDNAPVCQATPDHLAYVIYTSGSTGRPKGCAVTHRAALNTVRDINHRFQVTDRDVLFAISAMSFDLSVYDVFGGLGCGATLVLPASQSPNPTEWLALCQTHQVSIWNSVPALVEMLVTHAEDTGEVLPESMRLTMMSGDWIPLNLPPMLNAANPEMQVISLGGATEAAIWSIYHPVTTLPPDWNSIPYGKPLGNQTIHVLNAWMEDCPVWATGEIYIGGAGLAKGYYNDPDRTAASFIKHPLTGERLYRTGDMGRMRPEGVIEFLGRIDTQVKLRGYRIELGEIEDAMLKCDQVANAVAMITGDSNENRQLVAFVVPQDEVEDEQAFNNTLAQALQQRLPRYMVPGTFLHLQEIPLTANGKVDRKQLAAMGCEARTKVEYVAPRNDTEERIAKLWAELLNVERVGVHDDFFALGGNSLIASRLLIKIHDIFEIEVPFARLFEAANVAALSVIVIEQVLADIEAMEEA